METLPLFHSLIHRRPWLSDHTRRAPCCGVGGSTMRGAPVARSISAR